MTDLTKVEKLAQLKIQIKELTAEAKEIEKALIAGGAPKKLKTAYGTFTLTERPTYECIDKQKVFNEVGEGAFVAIASISLSTTKKVVGELMTEKLVAKGLFPLKSVSKYYQLRG